jgi:hypothetical protein
LPLQEPLVKHYIIGGQLFVLGFPAFIILVLAMYFYGGTLEYFFFTMAFVDFFMIAKENKNRVDLVL